MSLGAAVEGGPGVVSSEGAPSPQPHDKERDMARKSLLQMLEEVDNKLGLLEHEKRETVARIKVLENEAVELRNVISLAESKADDILKGGVTDNISESQAANVPAGSKGHEQLWGYSGTQQEDLKRRYPVAVSPE